MITLAVCRKGEKQMLANSCSYRNLGDVSFEEAQEVLLNGEKLGVKTTHGYSDGTADITEVTNPAQMKNLLNPESKQIQVHGLVAYKPKA
jgi:hypothetical protein